MRRCDYNRDYTNTIVYRYIYISYISYIYIYILHYGYNTTPILCCIIVSVCSTLLVAMNHYDAVHVLIINVCVCVRALARSCAHYIIHAGVSRVVCTRYTQTGHSSRRKKAQCETHVEQTSVLVRASFAFRHSSYTHCSCVYFLPSFFSFVSLASFCFSNCFSITVNACVCICVNFCVPARVFTCYGWTYVRVCVCDSFVTYVTLPLVVSYSS